MRPTSHLTLTHAVVKAGREEAARRGVSLSRLVEELIEGLKAPKEKTT